MRHARLLSSVFGCWFASMACSVGVAWASTGQTGSDNGGARRGAEASADAGVSAHPRPAGPGRSGETGDTSEASRRDRVVAKVAGGVITVGELEDKIASLAGFQRMDFGGTPDAIRHRLLNDVLIHDALLVAGSNARRLTTLPMPAARDEMNALARGVLRKVRSSVGTAASISDEDVRAYVEAHRDRFEQPERYGVWRVLCASEEEANTVLESAKKDASPESFNKLARDHSIDKATQYRGGNLGWLTVDGHSSEAGIVVDPALVAAALKVKEGEVVPYVVNEGGYFAVVVRRATVPAIRRSVKDVAPIVREAIYKQRVEKEERQLIDGLRMKAVRDVNIELLKGIDVPTFSGNLAGSKKGTLSR